MPSLNKPLLSLLTASILSSLASAASAETVKIALIEPLSGGMAAFGDGALRSMAYDAEWIATQGGTTFEIVPFDNKLNPKEALVQLQAAIDQGIRYVSQGQGSSVAHALTSAIEKHNKRNPGKELIFLNYAAVDPELTNDKCNYWHFRWDAHVDVKMKAIVDAMKDQTGIKKVYLINQDYSFGHAVADAAKKMIAAELPGVEIVGEAFHPIAKVKDFAPYVSKIKASGADTIITGNWGSDMMLLIKAGSSSGLDVNWLTFYGGGLGAIAGIGESGIGKVKQITEWHRNIAGDTVEKLAGDYKAKFPEYDYYYFRMHNMLGMLDKAIKDAGSSEPLKVAAKLEGMKFTNAMGDEIWMRADDHQLFQPMYLSTLSGDVKYGLDNTKLGFVTDKKIAAEDTLVSTTCNMTRP